MLSGHSRVHVYIVWISASNFIYYRSSIYNLTQIKRCLNTKQRFILVSSPFKRVSRLIMQLYYVLLFMNS